MLSSNVHNEPRANSEIAVCGKHAGYNFENVLLFGIEPEKKNEK